MIEVGRPCPNCGVRPDVACSHREADPDWRLQSFEEAEPKRQTEGQGLNFKTKKRYVSGGGIYRRKDKPK